MVVTEYIVCAQKLCRPSIFSRLHRRCRAWYAVVESRRGTIAGLDAATRMYTRPPCCQWGSNARHTWRIHARNQEAGAEWRQVLHVPDSKCTYNKNTLKRL